MPLKSAAVYVASRAPLGSLATLWIGLSFSKPAKFVRRYADVAGTIRGALTTFREDVRAGRYPAAAESYAAAPEAASPEKDPCAS